MTFSKLVAFLLAISPSYSHSLPRPTCIVQSGSDDDTPSILSAFHTCGHNGHIIFTPNATYKIGTVMTTTNLSNVRIDLHGHLLWSANTSFWLNSSMPIGYQNQSTVWFLGGSNIHMNGHSTGTLDGNGQAWYDLVKGISNYPRRPMALTIVNTTNSTFTGLRFIQSQMWTMTIMYSSNILLSDISINSTSLHPGIPARNTDGADILYSNNITMRRWEIENGDDAIALKGNSTNILIENCTFHRGQGFALGSIGQYSDRYEIIENVTVRDITCIRTKYAAYVKTWTGEKSGYPPNGGGGGKGYIRNISLSSFTLSDLRSSPFTISQCTAFGGTKRGDCDSSLFKISDIHLSSITGTVNSSSVAVMQCSKAAGGCENIEIDKDSVVVRNLTEQVVEGYLCSNVVSTEGFECTGNVTSNPGGS